LKLIDEITNKCDLIAENYGETLYELLPEIMNINLSDSFMEEAE
jgi:hypothetical protein